MLIRMLRQHLSYEPNKEYEVEDVMAQLYIRNGLAVPVETEPVIMTEGTHIPDKIAKKIVKKHGGRPRRI